MTQKDDNKPKTYDITVRFTLTDNEPNDPDYLDWKPDEDTIYFILGRRNGTSPFTLDFEEVLEIKENEE